MHARTLIAALLATVAAGAQAQTFNIDPGHTYPSFELAHNGISVFRGKFTRTTGTVTLDRAKKTGAVDIAIDPDSFDIGHAKLNSHVKSPDMLDVARFPAIAYKGALAKFDGERPVEVQGNLTMMGVTKPVNLTINSFKCIVNPMLKREVCGADAAAEFKRSDFGLTFGLPKHGDNVKLAIQIEAIQAE